MAKSWPIKDPDDVLDYGFNWSALIAMGETEDDDTIATTTAEVISGTMVVEDHDVGEVEGATTGKATVTWLSGGAEGEETTILLHIITVAGRELDQTMKIKAKSR